MANYHCKVLLLEAPRFLPQLLTILPIIIKRKPVMRQIPGLALTPLANAAALLIEPPLPAVVLAVKALTDAAVLGIERLLQAVVLALKVLADTGVLSIEGPLPAVVLALKVLADTGVLSIEGPLPAVVLALKVLADATPPSIGPLPTVVLTLKALIDAAVLCIEGPVLAAALIALVNAAALKVKGENGATGHNHCTAAGLGLDLNFHSTTAVFPPTIRDVQVPGRGGFHQKEGIRLLVHQEGTLSYNCLLGRIMQNHGLQGRAGSNHQVRLECDKCYIRVMKNSCQEGVPIKSCLQEVMRERGHEEGAVADDVHLERAVRDGCPQQELVINRGQ
ncbi:uncharacterized protein FYW61_019474 [Anableps anableps]